MYCIGRLLELADNLHFFFSLHTRRHSRRLGTRTWRTSRCWAPASVCAPFLATCCVAAPAKCKRERALAWTVGRDPPHLGRCSPVVLDVARVRGRGRTGAATVPVCGAAPHLSATNTFWVKINLARLVALGRRRRRNLRLLLFSRRRPSSVRRASHQSRFLVCFSQL